MAICVHIRNPRQWPVLARVGEHMTKIYDGLPLDGSPEWRASPASHAEIKPTGLYVGDEFCMPRMPEAAMLKRLCRMALSEGLELTLLAPALTETGLERCRELWDILADLLPRPRVVVNDLGTLHFIRHHYAGFELAAGRLMDKGFKDPRLARKDSDNPEVGIPDALIQERSYDQRELQEALKGISITTLERDVTPWANRLPDPAEGLSTSVYLPFGYVTSGRVCLMSQNKENPQNGFLPPLTCRRPCNRSGIMLHHTDFHYPIIQNGNTLFYLYPWQQNLELMAAAVNGRIDLVYQGILWRSRV